MVIGDCNVRIGEAQILYDDQVDISTNFSSLRRAKDKITDGKSKKFIAMCEEHDLILLNGRSRSDAEGNFTFIRGTSCSTIDFCLIKGAWVQYVTDFEVKQQIHSDHMPLITNISTHINPRPVNTLFLPSKLKWKDSKCTVYQQNLCYETALLTTEDLSPENFSDSCVSAIKKAAEPFQIARPL